MSSIKPGVYRHYKGQNYYVYEVATHSETEEKLVVYRTLYGDRSMWVRPFEMFTGTVEVDNTPVPRFKWIAGSESEIPA